MPLSLFGWQIAGDHEAIRKPHRGRYLSDNPKQRTFTIKVCYGRFIDVCDFQ